jgi:RHS repeat-associated protein
MNTTNRSLRHGFLSLLASLVCVGGASGQVATGFPPFGSFSGGPDIIDNANGNVHLTIPVFSRPGRGVSFSYALAYDSSIWSPYGAGYYGVWSPPTGGLWGWAAQSTSGAGSYFYSQTQACCPGQHCNPDLGTGTYYNKYTGWVYIDHNGTQHNFGATVNDSSILCSYGTGNWSTTTTATDGSALTMTVDATPEATFVHDIQGDIFDLQNSITKDRNGNEIAGGFDTLSSTTLPLTISSGNPTTYTYTTSKDQQATVKVNYQTFTVRTNFGCNGVTEYGPTSAGLVTEIDLPNSTKYTFTYEPTPGYSGDVTGRLASITLPTGGSISYSYSGINNGINCFDGSAETLSRTLSDGASWSATWTYARTLGSGGASATLITAPKMPYDSASNQTIIQFQGIYEAQRDIYQGSAPAFTSVPIPESTLTTSNLLQEAQTCYNGSASPCTSTAPTAPISQISAISILAGSGNLQSRHVDFLNSYSITTEKDDYDYGSGAPGALLRKTLITYANLGTYLQVFPQTVTIKDGNGNIKYRKDMTYDQYSGGLTCVTGAPEHDDTNYGCSFTSRANVTSVTNYTDPVTPGGAITKNFTYDSLGNVRTAQLNCCQLKTWNYSSTASYAFPDSVVNGSSSPQVTSSYTYDLHMGVALTTTDPNNLKTTFTYDNLGRPLTVTQASNPAITYTYTDSGNWSVQVCRPIQGTNNTCQKSILDGLGRSVTAQALDGNSNLYSATDSQYDPLGRPYKTSNPYTSSASYWTQTNFDALGRAVKTTLPDSSVSTNSYSDNTFLTADPAGIQRKSVFDGVARLTSVYEPDPTSNNSLTLQTTSAYNVLDELTQVTQGSQTRTYAYDALGRLNTATTPEAGTVCFGTYSGGSCQNGYDAYDNLQYRTDARGVVTNYIFDSLNRLLGITYPTVPTGVSAMPNVCKTTGSSSNNANVCFTYGTSAASYNNGLPIAMTDTVGSENYTYNALEQLTQLQKVINGTTYTTSYAYNLASELTQITYPSGRIVQQSVDAIGRLCEIAPSTNGCGTASAPYATGYGYGTASQVTGFKYGNGLYASFGFSSDRLQLNCLDYSTTNRGTSCTHDSTTKFGLNYSYPSSPGNNGLFSGITDSVDSGRSATYTYDSLYRLTSAATAGSTNYPAWGLSQTYDRYGNRNTQSVLSGCTGITCPTFSGTSSTTSNRLPSPSTYDSNGNMTYDGANTLVYDGENHATSASGTGGAGSNVYDGNGLRVQKCLPTCGSSNPNTVYVFSGSKVIAEYDNGAVVGSPSREYIYAGASLLAKIDSSGTKYFHQDHLSNRLITDASGNIVAQQGHFPFGEQWYPAPPASPPTKWEFTTYEHDSESGNDYAQARYNVSRLARFSSPDPIAGNTSDPQSLNRYSYVRNMPMILSDPSGLFSCITAHKDSDQDTGAAEESNSGGPSHYAADSDPWNPEPQRNCQLPPNAGWLILDGQDISGYSAGGGGMGYAAGGGGGWLITQTQFISGSQIFGIYDGLTMIGPCPEDLVGCNNQEVPIYSTLTTYQYVAATSGTSNGGAGGGSNSGGGGGWWGFAAPWYFIPKGLKPPYAPNVGPPKPVGPINPTEPPPEIPVLDVTQETLLGKIAEVFRDFARGAQDITVPFFISPCGPGVLPQPGPNGLMTCPKMD